MHHIIETIRPFVSDPVLAWIVGGFLAAAGFTGWSISDYAVRRLIADRDKEREAHKFQLECASAAKDSLLEEALTKSEIAAKYWNMFKTENDEVGRLERELAMAEEKIYTLGKGRKVANGRKRGNRKSRSKAVPSA